MIFERATCNSPIGEVVVAVRDGRVSALSFADHWSRLVVALQRRLGEITFHPAQDPAGVVSRLQRYFAGELDALNSVAVEPAGTGFQQAVWTELRKIPPGRTASYGEIARAIGAPAAVRAVGAANGANPISIVIPCHRIIGANGTLTGYGGGMERKRWLLQHEATQLPLAKPMNTGLRA